MYALENLRSNLQQLKPVCYRCGTAAIGKTANRCPSCSFPLIAEVGRLPTHAPRVRDILDRTSVKTVKAPPLPGVNEEKRQAQLRAEERERRRIRMLQSQKQAKVQGVGGTTVRRANWFKVAMLFASAVSVGLAAAVWLS